MPDLQVFRSLFRPLQPSVSAETQQVSYQEVWPELALQPYIYCYWELKTLATLQEPFYYRVVADGCIDVFFDLSQTSQNYIMGFSSTYTEFPLESNFHYIGIRFLPMAFPGIFQINAAELSNRFESLNLIVPSLSIQLAQIAEMSDSLEKMKGKLDNYFSQILVNQNVNIDSRLLNAAFLILQKQGILNIEREIDTGLSPRQLRRLFEFYIGDTPKIFSKIVRFQNILNAKPSGESLRKNKLFYDVGYYDQAHFIKEFKTMYGLTPSKAFTV
jgi:hypothetical protein